jgi:hypothetical protein
MKIKETNKETSTNNRKPKEHDHLKKTSLSHLRKGQQLDTTETKTRSNNELKTTKLKLKKYKSSPYIDACKPLHKIEHLHQLSSDRSDRSTTPVRPVPNI